MSKQVEFDAPMIDAGGGGVFVEFPFDAMETFGKKNLIKIKATIDGEPYRGSLANMGTQSGKLILIVLKKIREKIGKKIGDTVHCVVELDDEPRVIEVPEDLHQLLHTSHEARTYFDSLSYSHKKEYVNWIEEAKRPETRQSRLQKTIEMLEQQKKRS